MQIEYESGVAWVSLDRPVRRSSMNPIRNAYAHEALDDAEADDRAP